MTKNHSKLVSLMRQCEIDTRETISIGAANMLAHWQKHETDLDRLVKFIHDRIYTDNGAINGWTLENANKLSLERIVAFHCPELFSPSEVRKARETLGNPK